MKIQVGAQICWTCQNACGGCSWADRLEPVPGWAAIPVRMQHVEGVMQVPCGHCGKQAYISVDPECEPDSTGRKWAYTVVCGTCCATSGLCYSADMARLAWNTRAPILSESELKKLRGGGEED